MTNVIISTKEAKQKTEVAAAARPVITSQQTQSVVQSGNPHVLEIVAKGRGLTYQWQMDNGLGWKLLKGETSATLTTKAKALHNMPETYRCIVSNKGGSTVSQLISGRVLASPEDKEAAAKAKAKEDTPLHIKPVGAVKSKVEGSEDLGAYTGINLPNPAGVEDDLSDEGAMEEVLSQEPIVEEPIVEEPIVEEPIVEEPIVEEPIVEEPTVEEPTVEEPTVEIKAKASKAKAKATKPKSPPKRTS